MNADAIAAIVVTHQSAETIGECLSRLRAAEGVAEIRVVDNASADGTLEIVQRQAIADPRVRFIANPDNPVAFLNRHPRRTRRSRRSPGIRRRARKPDIADPATGAFRGNACPAHRSAAAVRSTARRCRGST